MLWLAVGKKYLQAGRSLLICWLAHTLPCWGKVLAANNNNTDTQSAWVEIKMEFSWHKVRICLVYLAFFSAALQDFAQLKALKDVHDEKWTTLRSCLDDGISCLWLSRIERSMPEKGTKRKGGFIQQLLFWPMSPTQIFCSCLLGQWISYTVLSKIVN